MNSSEILKKSFGFLTAAVLSASFAGCSGEKSRNSSTETPTEEATVSAETTAIVTEKNTAAEEKNVSADTVRKPYNELFSDRDISAEYGSITAEIKLDGDSVDAQGDGISVDGCAVTIFKEGIYRISGRLDDGQIIVNAPKAKVQLVLDNADITCKNSAPVYGADSDKIFVTLAENSVNTLTDGTSYSFADEQNSEPDACIFSCDSITLNGSGSLGINANFADGIHSKDDIVITGGNITINSAEDGIKGKDYTAINGGKIDIKSGQDGIKSTETDDTAYGFVYINGGDISIDAVNDGIQAETDAVIHGGDVNIISGGGYENAVPKQNDMGFGGRDFGGMVTPGGFGGAIPQQTAYLLEGEDDSAAVSDSTKGIKGGSSVEISGGNITVDSADDAIHSNKNITINGAVSQLLAGGDGIHADSTIDISGGTVSIEKSYEGIEGAVINISGGEVSLVSSDDGFNATDGTTSQGGMGTYSHGVELNISGGIVYADAQGDGLDSNGNMTVSGGVVLVNGPTNGGNGSLDGNGEIIVNGGILAAAGSAQMAEAPTDNSVQCCVSANFGTAQVAGTLVALTDEAGNELFSYAPAKTFEHIVISIPEIEKGKTYTLSAGGTSSAEEDYGLYEIGGYDGKGTAVGTFTAENTISYIGEQSMMGGGFGGRGDKGGFGGHGRENFQPTTDENGNPVMPERGEKPFGRGDFQPPTDENGGFLMPERPKFPFGDESDMPQ
ncbi:MAG: carbohydrate-binding domain-containing protein [Ruminococcus sp.]|nr:carbohydrate-binding domain-containing protein [Ruminococcus sp.]